MCSNLLPLISRSMLIVTIMNQKKFSVENILFYKSEQKSRKHNAKNDITIMYFMDFWNCTFPCNELRVTLRGFRIQRTHCES